MSNPDPFGTYLQKLRKNLATGVASEHTHRSALEALLEATGDGVRAVNEPKRVECGAPDYIITRAGTPIGYVEAKDVGTSLDAGERSEQMRRYRASLNNLILTDYLEFRWYVEGEHRETARLAAVTEDGKVKRSRGGVQAVADLLQKFFAQEVPTLGRPKELAERMAALALMTRNLIEETFRRESEEGMLHAQLKAFRETLIPFLTPVQFADMYAQTIAYGLFAARVRTPSLSQGEGRGGGRFTRQQAAWNLPRTNPFLRDLFNEIAGPGLDERVAWAVDDLAYLLARADMAEVLKDFGKATKQEDPVVHFYETFLAAYDPQMRQRRGVYYTPEPVVSYIVRSLDHIVKTHFDRPLGLANTDTLILDPAAGTATFLYFVIQQIHQTLMTMGQAGGWNDYVDKHLLPRVFGFELLMAPYAVAHMKLGILLQETGYDFTGDQRLGIYLTNSLEEAITRAETLGFARFISDEANAAAEVKRDKPIMVVLGNPPYSVSSANKGDHIERLMERYKAAVRDEQNIQPLSDDYIKFIRFAHDRIERTGYGVIGMITNHTYLSGLIHRGMREELLTSFSEIYLLNLHGSALLGETAPAGGKDENVFDIRQGVAIALFVKQPPQTSEVSETSEVYYADLWGLRDGKYRYLLENDVSATEWQTLEPMSPYFFFVPKDFDLLSEYERGWSVTRIFAHFSTGVGTGRDSAFVAFEPESIQQFVQDLRNPAISDEVITEKYSVRDTSGWNFFRRRGALIEEGKKSVGNIVQYQYRPFDVRFTFYHPIIRRDQRQTMRHMSRDNLALLLCQQQATIGFQHAFCTRHIVDESVISARTRERGYVFPLYLYPEKREEKPLKGGGSAVILTLFESQPEYTTPQPNLAPAFITAVKEKLGLDFVPDGKGDLQTTFGPEDIFHYAYAVFHSPTYRQRYAEFLKIDFPRLPLTSDRALFKALAEKGEELVALHLMESPALNNLITRFSVAGSDKVEKVRYVEPVTEEKEPPADAASSSVKVISPKLPLTFDNEVRVKIQPRAKKPTGRVYINKTQYFEGIAPDVWEFQIGGYQVLHKWLKDRKGRKLSFDDLFHYQKIVVALKETMRLMEEIDELIPSWPIE
jgi:hypothetical protein